MMTIETLLLGLVGGLVGLKIGLLATAALLFVYGLTEHARQRKVVRVPAPVRQPRLDVHA